MTSGVVEGFIELVANHLRSWGYPHQIGQPPAGGSAQPREADRGTGRRG